MNVKRTLSLGLGAGAVVAWLAAAGTSGSRPIAPQLREATYAVETSGAQLASEISRLHERLRPTTAPLQSRDLFRYASRSPSTLAAPRAASAPEPAPAPIAPALRLVGIAEDGEDAAVVRTAILSGFGDLFLAKEGETVTSRYRVSRISSDAVELMDSLDQTTLRLGLP